MEQRGSGLLGLLLPNLGSQALPGALSCLLPGAAGQENHFGGRARSDHADFSLLFLNFPASTLTSFFIRCGAF